MRPENLQASSFATYPPRARSLAVAHLRMLQQLPLSFLGLLLSELIAFDWRFPAEQAEITGQLRTFAEASPSQLAEWMAEFRSLAVTSALYDEPWAAEPAAFVEKLTAYLWTVHAIDAFRSAALKLGEQIAAKQPSQNGQERWCLVVVGREAQAPCPDLFRQLRRQGTLFTQVSPAGGMSALSAFVQARAAAEKKPYAHWHVEGGALARPGSEAGVTAVSYEALAPVRMELLQRMHHASTSGTVGPESLRSLMAQLRPADLPWRADAHDDTLRHFELSLLTEGSGTQIFSTTFVQWAAREILRRAKPSTLLLRYAPRQADRPMNDLLLASAAPPVQDPEGSLLDASMGAYYTWINLQRLPGAAAARFLAWRETGTEAVAIAPSMAKGSTSTQPCTMDQLLKWMA